MQVKAQGQLLFKVLVHSHLRHRKSMANRTADSVDYQVFCTVNARPRRLMFHNLLLRPHHRPFILLARLPL